MLFFRLFTKPENGEEGGVGGGGGGGGLEGGKQENCPVQVRPGFGEWTLVRKEKKAGRCVKA